MLDNYVALNEKCLLRIESFGGIIANYENGKSLELNKQDCAIIENSKGSLKLKELIKNLIDKKLVDCKSFAEMLVYTINLIKDKWLIVSDSPIKTIGKILNNIIACENEVISYNSPFQVTISVTGKCNLKCLHCYRGEENDYFVSPDYKTIIQRLDFFHELGIINIQLSGGEPFIRTDIIDIVKYAVRKFPEVTLLTNGTLITDQMAKELSEMKINVQIGFSEIGKEFDIFTGVEGSYSTTRKSIQNLIKYGLKPSIGIVLNKRNTNKLGSIIETFSQLGIEIINIDPLLMIGNTLDNLKELKLPKMAWENALMDVYEISKDYPHLKIVFSEGILTSENIKSKTYANRERFCFVGEGIIHVESNGDLFLCQSFLDKDFCIGNLNHLDKISFLELWHNSKILNELRSLTTKDLKGCKNCDFLPECGGGCRLMAFYETGKLNEKFPLCDEVKSSLGKIKHKEECKLCMI